MAIHVCRPYRGPACLKVRWAPPFDGVWGTSMGCFHFHHHFLHRRSSYWCCWCATCTTFRAFQFWSGWEKRLLADPSWSNRVQKIETVKTPPNTYKSILTQICPGKPQGSVQLSYNNWRNSLGDFFPHCNTGGYFELSFTFFLTENDSIWKKCGLEKKKLVGCTFSEAKWEKSRGENTKKAKNLEITKNKMRSPVNHSRNSWNSSYTT